MTLFPLTKCSKCGADVRRMDDRLYRLDIQGALHGCDAPTQGLPQAEGIPMLLDLETGVLVPMDAE